MSHVQGAKSDYSSRSSIALPFPSNNSSGNLIVVYLSGANNSNIAISDTQGNTYQQLFKDATSFGATNTQVAWYAQGIKSGANTVNVSWTTAETSALAIAEYDGIQTSGSLDQGHTAAGNSTAWDSGNITTTHAHDTLIAFTAAGLGITSTSAPFAQYQVMQSGGTTFGQIAEDVNQPIGTYHASGACTNGQWTAAIFSFIGAAPSPATVSPTSGSQGATISNFTVNGTGFTAGATISFSGTGITVNSYSVQTATQIVASITIAISATVSVRDVIVTNSDTQTGTLSSAFTIGSTAASWVNRQRDFVNKR